MERLVLLVDVGVQHLSARQVVRGARRAVLVVIHHTVDLRLGDVALQPLLHQFVGPVAGNPEQEPVELGAQWLKDLAQGLLGEVHLQDTVRVRVQLAELDHGFHGATGGLGEV